MRRATEARRHRGTRPVDLVAALALLACGGAPALPQTDSFAGLVEHLSEPGGHFDTDNLVSNERSYLHVVDALEGDGAEGGAFIGVGPDQSFSYIAVIRPEIAYILDVRRDNMLEHLIFKALFAVADTRIEYLSALFGRRPPDDAPAWEERDIEALLAHVDSARMDSAYLHELREAVDSVIAGFGVRLSRDDWATIDRFHRTFMSEGLDLQFWSFGRAPRHYYPTYRELVLERTRLGRRASFVATGGAYRVVRDLQRDDRVIPVTGDFAGKHALRAIGRDIARRGLTVSAFYTSNVEFYLFRQNTFGAFVGNVAALPFDDRAVIIRSVFLTSYPDDHPDALPGYASVQLLQPVDRMVRGYRRGEFPRYWSLVDGR
jgi:hypothetical protein